MSDVHKTQTTGSNQSQADARDMLVVSELGVRSQNKAILEEISFKVKKGTSLAIVGLITHNIHVVMHYADYVLALNKRVLFFGDSKSLTHSQLLSVIYGNEFALSEERYHKE